MPTAVQPNTVEPRARRSGGEGVGGAEEEGAELTDGGWVRVTGDGRGRAGEEGEEIRGVGSCGGD